MWIDIALSFEEKVALGAMNYCLDDENIQDKITWWKTFFPLYHIKIKKQLEETSILN